jgi:two-component system response regulator LytT
MSDFNIECAIIDDEIHASDRLKDILDDFESIEILSVHNTYQDALEVLLDTRPRVIFLDIELDKNHTAFELIEQINSNCYFPYIILVTARIRSLFHQSHQKACI